MKNDDILVSIEIITYNHEKFLAKALDSVLMQEVDFKYEIVVGEDCSTDNTRQILLEYKDKYPDKFRLLLHDKNVGMRKNGEAVSEFSAESKSKYIALLEGDDYWIDPQKLQVQIDTMEEHPDCYISFHAAESRYGEDDHGEVIAKHSDSNRLFSTSEVILGGGDFSPTSSIVYRSDLRPLLPDNYYDVPVGDYYLQIIGSTYGGILYLNRVMGVYRQGIEGSWSSSMENIDKREQHSHGMLQFINDLNIYLDKKYDSEIQQIIAKHYYDKASYYLSFGMYEKFKMNIENSFDTYKLDSNLFLVDYKLRNFPKVLKTLRRVKVFFQSSK